MSTLFEQHVERAVHPHLEAALAEPDPWRGLRHSLEATLATVVQHQGLLHAGHDVGLVPIELRTALRSESQAYRRGLVVRAGPSRART